MDGNFHSPSDWSFSSYGVHVGPGLRSACMATPLNLNLDRSYGIYLRAALREPGHTLSEARASQETPPNPHAVAVVRGRDRLGSA